MGGFPSGQGMSLSVSVLEAGCNAFLRAAGGASRRMDSCSNIKAGLLGVLVEE